jgi:TolB-like protein/dienelactone hydrolase
LNLLTELRRRKVYQVAAVYGAASWVLLQVADVLFPGLGLPGWSVTFLFALEVVGFPLAVILSWIFDFTPDGMVRTGAKTGAVAASRDRESLAVLPFNNMSDDPSLDHLSDGLVEDLITRLQGNLDIPVNSRNSTFCYKGEAIDVVKVSSELGAAFVVEGSVRVQGDTARVTAQLIDATNDHHLWAEKFDRPHGDIFALQDELVESIAEAIMRHVPAGEPETQTPSEAVDAPVGLHKGWVAAVAMLVLGLSGLLTWSLEQRGDERWAREVVLPEIEKRIEADDRIGAYSRIQEIQEILPSDPLLLQYRDELSALATILTAPPGIGVAWKPYEKAEAEWQYLGLTPLREVRLPQGYLRLKFEGDAVTTTERLVANPSLMLGNFHFIPSEADAWPEPLFRLAPADQGRADMVYVAPWEGLVAVPGGTTKRFVAVPGFYIDTYEVTNAQFQEFVDAGAYGEPRYWNGFEFDGREWSDVVAAFTDETGQPGPAAWEWGRYLHGTADHPVTGVSWFEASAYARFRGKELPTIYHWYRAALDYMETVAPLSPAIIKQSNFSGQGTAPVGQNRGLGFFGAYDMGGNAREWLLNAEADLRWIAGGGWNQVPYMLPAGDFVSPFDRSPINGFRCIESTGPVPAELAAPTQELSRSESVQTHPVSDEVYAVFRDQFGYLRQDSEPRLVSEREWPRWREERVRINSPYSEDGLELMLLLPEGNGAPLQAVVLMPGSDAFSPGARMEGYDWEDYEPSVAAVLHSGRAIVLPFWDGAFSRGRRWTGDRYGEPDRFREYTRSRIMHWRQDLGTALDFLETREDIDSERIGYLGISFGAIQPMAILAVESRLKAAVLVAGGLAGDDYHSLVRPVNHVSRITMPVLMLNGRYDYLLPMDEMQKPLFELLGSVPDQKKHVVYDSGHVGFPANQQRREIRAWLDTHLGKVP